MKKLSIPSAMVGLTFGLIATAFVYLFVPPPSTASADDCDCPSVYPLRKPSERIQAVQPTVRQQVTSHST